MALFKKSSLKITPKLKFGQKKDIYVTKNVLPIQFWTTEK
jgi:hypothetical protein